ncbi:MAG TPA: hypothetical protein VEV13_07635, partial [Candidatus Limnocylindria bacterium]|nr:hypothetical protein [Candidatus Limnocylindria bacterium]
RNARWTVDGILVGAPAKGRSVSTVRYRTAPYVTVDKAGKTIESFSPYAIQSSVVLLRGNEGWTVQAFDTLSRVEQ